MSRCRLPVCTLPGVPGSIYCERHLQYAKDMADQGRQPAFRRSSTGPTAQPTDATVDETPQRSEGDRPG